MIWIVMAALAAAVLAGSWPRYRRARAAQAAELGRWDEVRSLVRRSAGQGGAGQGPAEAPPSLPQAASEALSEAGLPASALVGVSPGQDTVVEGPIRITRQQATATLQVLSLSELGRLLDRWRRSGSGWTITGIDVSPLRGQAAVPGTDLPLRAVLDAEIRSVGPEAPP
jgi:hypothetical protein